MFAGFRNHDVHANRIIGDLGRFALLVLKGVHSHIFGSRNILLQGVKYLARPHQGGMCGQRGEGPHITVGHIAFKLLSVLVQGEI
ncbi:hypothetical protein D3C75_804380 [compost metagenome]